MKVNFRRAMATEANGEYDLVVIGGGASLRPLLTSQTGKLSRRERRRNCGGLRAVWLGQRRMTENDAPKDPESSAATPNIGSGCG